MRTKIRLTMALAALACSTQMNAASAAPAQTVKVNNLTWTVPLSSDGPNLAGWSGADKHCKQMGARLPTKDELIALNRSGQTPDNWFNNVTTTATPFGTNKHYTVFMGQLDGLGWSSDSDPQIVTCVK
jgi:formylglycine-generating enzyme required for sulfatase activity